MKRSSDWHLKREHYSLLIEPNSIFEGGRNIVPTIVNLIDGVNSLSFGKDEDSPQQSITRKEQNAFPVYIQKEKHSYVAIVKQLTPILGEKWATSLTSRVKDLLEKPGAVSAQSGGGGFLVKSYSQGGYYPVNFTGSFPVCENERCKSASDKVICSHILAVFVSNLL